MANFPDKEDFFGSLNVAAEVAADFDVTFNDTFSVVDTQAEVDESAIGVLEPEDSGADRLPGPRDEGGQFVSAILSGG